MAIFHSTVSAIGVDMSALPYFHGTTTFASSDRITVTDGVQTQEYFGSFSFTGNSISGQLTRTTYSNASTGRTYAASDFSVDAGMVLSYIDSGNLSAISRALLAGNDRIIGSTANDRLFGYEGNDWFYGGYGDDFIDGGPGIDTASYLGNRASFLYTFAVDTIAIQDFGSRQGFDVLLNVERLQFSDVSVAFDIGGNAGQAYRLYQAAFDRQPDKAGLGTWINYMDKGHSLKEVSSLFQQSTEFVTKYGPNLSTADFVTLLYQNVLHRAPDAGGMTTWSNLLNTHQMDRADVLIGFSESAENKAALIGVQQNGMEFIPVI